MIKIPERQSIKSVYLLLIFLSFGFTVQAQYTDVINSNRPGRAVSAYAVGTNVLQGEMGLTYEKQKHNLLDTDSNIWGIDFALRYGLLFESLELVYEGTFVNEKLQYAQGDELTQSDFTRNRAGLKFLIYDPFKNPENNKPNLYSWRANNKFQWKNLIPAVSVYGGANFTFGDNPYYAGDPTLTYRAMIATQSRLTPRMVLILNAYWDRITSDSDERGYIVSVTHALRDPKWSIFLENQGFTGDRYSDNLLRGGAAYLFGPNFQVDVLAGINFKDTPSRVFGGIGASYRLDMHQDKLLPANDGFGGPVKKNSMKKRAKKEKKEKKKSKGEDTLGSGEGL